MKHFEELENFINSNIENWQSLLKEPPFNLTGVKQCPYNSDWYILTYNLYASDFTNPIVKECRGTIVEIKDNKCKVICAPFLKFFNYGDKNCDTIDWTTAIIREKIDGQLIKMFKNNGSIFWVTNGSFDLDTGTSFYNEDVSSIKELLSLSLENTKNFNELKLEWTKNIPDGWTLMFELTSPYNKIIVEYDEIKLWFLGARDADGNEHHPEEIKQKFNIPYDIPQQYNLKSFEECLKLLKDFNGKKQEGVVVCDNYFHRVKIKCDDFLKIKFKQSKLAINPQRLFRIVLFEQDDDFLESFPEYYDQILDIKKDFNEFLTKFKQKIDNIKKECSSFEDNKKLSQYILTNHKNETTLFFGASKKSFDEIKASVIKDFKTGETTTNYNKYIKFKKKYNLL